MTNLVFKHSHALKAIQSARKNGRDWLYENYPKPDGKMRKSSTGFLMHEGQAYPVKPLGRLANEIAGAPMTENPITNVFRRYFEDLGFELIESPEDEAETAADRQRYLALVWERPGQAKFRRAVFDIFGARCVITGCVTLTVLEAAHILPVASGGDDDGWNGIPLRADLHRLFDAGLLMIDPTTWQLSVNETVQKDYGQFQGIDLSQMISELEGAQILAVAFQKRMELSARKTR